MSRIAYSSTGPRFCIAYYDATNGNLKIAKSANVSSWYVENVDASASDVGTHCSIAINGADVYMAHVTTGSIVIRRAYATNVSMSAATTWTIPSQTLVGVSPSYTSIAINGANGVICFKADDDGLQMVRTTDSFVTLVGGPDISVIDSGAGAGGYARMRYTSSGFMISHTRSWSSPTQVRFHKLVKSTDNGVSWTTVLSSGGTGMGSYSYPIFAVDGSGST